MPNFFRNAVLISIALNLLSAIGVAHAQATVQGNTVDPINATNPVVAQSVNARSPRNQALAQANRASEVQGLEQYLIALNRSAVVAINSKNKDAADQDSVAEISLSEAVAQSKNFSSVLASSNSRLLQAEYQQKSSLGGLLPRIDLRYATGQETSSPASIIDAEGKQIAKDTHSRTDTTITLTQPLFDWTAINEWRKQSHVRDAARAEYEGVFDSHVLGVVEAYHNLIQSRLALNLTEEYDIQVNGLLRYIQTRSNAGAISKADEDRVKGRVLNIRAANIEIEGQFEAALIAFKRLTGVTPNSIVIPQPLEPSVPTTAEEALQLALSNNPEVTAARLLLSSAEKSQSSSFGKLLPKLDFQYSDTSAANAGGVDFTQKNNTLMLVGSWNVLNGGVDYYQHRIAAEKFNEQKFNIKEAERKIQEGIDLSINAYQSTRGRIEAAGKEQVANRAVVLAYVKQLQSGTRTVADLLDAYQRLYQTRIDLLRLTIARVGLAYQIARLTGDLRVDQSQQ